MLKTYLSRQGLALESGEVVDGEVTVLDQVASADELTEQHEAIASDSSDMEAAEESEATLESLVLLMGNRGRTFTSLESALINEKIAFAYSNIGLSTESLSLESGDIALSMEGISELLSQIGSAVKEGYFSLREKVKDFLAKVFDHCNRSAKLFGELKSKLNAPEYKVSASAAKLWGSFAAGLGDTPITRVFSDLQKASKMLLVDYVKQIEDGIDRLEADYTSRATIRHTFIVAEVYFNPMALGKKVNFNSLKLPKSPRVEFGGRNTFKGHLANPGYRLRLTHDYTKASLPQSLSSSDLKHCCDSLISALKLASDYIRDWRRRDAQLDKMIKQVKDNRAARVGEDHGDSVSAGNDRFIRWTMASLNERTTMVPREWINYIVGFESVLTALVGSKVVTETAPEH